MRRDDPFFERMAFFTNALLRDLDAAGLLDQVAQIDHVCYRVETWDGYARMKEALAPHGTLLAESEVNGRPIACYALHEAVPLTDGSSVSVLELPAPKAGSPYPDGFEHIEAVTRCALEELIRKHPALAFDAKNLGATNNRDIGLRLPHGLVKFHEQSLETVIAAELAVNSL